MEWDANASRGFVDALEHEFPGKPVGYLLGVVAQRYAHPGGALTPAQATSVLAELQRRRGAAPAAPRKRRPAEAAVVVVETAAVVPKSPKPRTPRRKAA